jgi:DHA1 family tetracycline resistance protein-like MFS transporter
LAPKNRRPFDWRRSNPFGVFTIFATYQGVLPMCAILFVFFFSTSVYPAIWPYWGIAKFGWSEAMIGLTLAAFGLVMAGFQGGLAGPAVQRFGEHRMVILGLACGGLAALGYGFAGGLSAVLILIIVHGPEGFVQPFLTAMMSKAVPDDAQGELQGGLSAITNVAMLFGTVFYSHIFGRFMREDAGFRSPDVGFWIAAAGMGLSLLMFLILVKRTDAGEKGKV